MKMIQSIHASSVAPTGHRSALSSNHQCRPPLTCTAPVPTAGRSATYYSGVACYYKSICSAVNSGPSRGDLSRTRRPPHGRQRLRNEARANTDLERRSTLAGFATDRQACWLRGHWRIRARPSVSNVSSAMCPQQCVFSNVSSALCQLVAQSI